MILYRILQSKFVCLSIFFLFLAGCQGARARVEFNNAQYPISLTSVVPDTDWQLLDSKNLEKVGKFEADDRGWSLFWTLLTLTNVDFSEELNKQVQEVDGDAVVNLKIKVGTPIFPDVLPGFLFVHWIPISPGSVYVLAEGDIVRSIQGK